MAFFRHLKTLRGGLQKIKSYVEYYRKNIMLANYNRYHAKELLSRGYICVETTHEGHIEKWVDMQAGGEDIYCLHSTNLSKGPPSPRFSIKHPGEDGFKTPSVGAAIRIARDLQSYSI